MDDVCPICLFREGDMVALTCKHHYHKECLEIYVDFGYTTCCLCGKCFCPSRKSIRRYERMKRLKERRITLYAFITIMVFFQCMICVATIYSNQMHGPSLEIDIMFPSLWIALFVLCLMVCCKIRSINRDIRAVE